AEVHDVLKSHRFALCAAETDESADADALMVPTADWGYIRLRSTDYTDDDLLAWRNRIARQPWDDAYVFFKHEDEGKGPEFARRFRAQEPA
ncbi:MAG TPA: DUF72 domain-containing protein, partial [Thermoanaerobaculia bacterium]|nr:DUF72 domain-containing protein [Thermoanaerobaculia bacterium]